MKRTSESRNRTELVLLGGTGLFVGRSGAYRVSFKSDSSIPEFIRSYLPQQSACLTYGFRGFVLQESELVNLREENELRGHGTRTEFCGFVVRLRSR